ncbi:MAG: nucleotide exchange factor GrpE [Lentisphaeria bacterium]
MSKKNSNFNEEKDVQTPESENVVEKDTNLTPQEETPVEPQDSAPPPPPPTPTTEELLAQANDRFLRARADFENYRKRMAREFGEVRDTCRQQTIAEFLNVYDMFLLAVEHAEQATDLESLKQGLKMILGEFQRTFENLGVKKIETIGQDFDPGIHEATSQEASDSVPEGKIIREWKAGFMLNSKLLRTATVIISAGKKTPEQP